MGRRPKPPDEKQTRTSFFLSPELKEGLTKLKEDIGVPETESVRRALKEYLTSKGYNLDQLKIDAVERKKREKKEKK